MLELFQTYWPAVLIVLGVGCLIYGITEDEVCVGVFGLIFWAGLGVLFFIKSPTEVWDSNRWPSAILVVLGVGGLIYGVTKEEIGAGVFGLLFFAGLGVLFFVKSPREAWEWLIQLEVVQFLIRGAWYEVVLKIGGAIGAIALALRATVLLVSLLDE